LLRPVLECLRRDLVSQAAIAQLTRTVTARDRDVDLLLADGPQIIPRAMGLTNRRAFFSTRSSMWVVRPRR